MLGYGWEWDEPAELVRRTPGAAFVTFDWSPASALARVASDLASTVNRLLAALPPSVEQVVVIGHSAAGLVTAMAADRIAVPPGRRLLVANVGSPYAGMHTTFLDENTDQVGAIFFFAIGGSFTRYPTPAPGVAFESWVTGWPGDPVMRPRFGHQPDDPRVGPPGPRHALPAGADHNKILGAVVRELLAREAGATPTPRPPL